MDGEFGVSRCKLFHLEWISTEVLLYSTGNSSQCLVIDHVGTECVCVCVCVTGSLSCTAEIDTTL